MNVTNTEHLILTDLAVGLSNRGIAQRRGLGESDVAAAVNSLIEKLSTADSCDLLNATGMAVFAPRTRLIFLAIRSGLLDANELAKEDEQLEVWLDA